MDNIELKKYTKNIETIISYSHESPWGIISKIESIISDKISSLDDDYKIDNDVAIHKDAKIEQNVIIKGPAIINEGCFVAANNYIRGGVFLDNNVTVGPSCEIKSSIILSETTIAHMNFIGDSIIGSCVNFEGGAITANHFNEKKDKQIKVKINNDFIGIGSDKFGAIIGDNSKIGANAVTSPGTILEQNSIVDRLELINQNRQT